MYAMQMIFLRPLPFWLAFHLHIIWFYLVWVSEKGFFFFFFSLTDDLTENKSIFSCNLLFFSTPSLLFFTACHFHLRSSLFPTMCREHVAPTPCYYRMYFFAEAELIFYYVELTFLSRLNPFPQKNNQCS